METKANTAVIGALTLAVIAFAFGFVYWLADSGISKENLTVVFRGKVAGLDIGSDSNCICAACYINIVCLSTHNFDFCDPL